MQFDTFSDFLAMGKHGVFVWSAYALVLISMLILHIRTYRQHKRLSQQLQTYKQQFTPPSSMSDC